MTLARAAPLFGLPLSSLSDLERGTANFTLETAARIEGVTGGQVTAADLMFTFRYLHPDLFSTHRAAGRSAMAEYVKAAKTRRKKHG